MNLLKGDQAGASSVLFDVRRPAIFGVLAILVFFGGLGAWASTAPIAGATIAPGLLVASGQNKVIQHLEGGILADILVAEGERVEAGAAVFVLDRTAAETDLNRLTMHASVTAAHEARLLAERNGEESLRFPAALIERKSDPLIARLLDDQRAEFNARHDRHKSELGILGKRVQAFEEEITGIGAQNEAIDQQLELIEQELAGLADLFEKGLTTQQRYLALKRTKAGLFGERGQNIAKIANVRQKIAQSLQEIHRAKAARQEEASTALTKTRAELQDTENQILIAKDVLDRSVIRSPIAGTIVDLGVHTIGEVIKSGQQLLEILPIDAALLVEARVRPENIDVVKVGQTATIMLSALNQRTTPVVEGQVEYISADRLTDKITQEPYYLARLRLADLTESGIGLADLYPGMQVDTFIRTPDRTFVEYLVRPIRDSFQKAFKEN